MISTLHTKAGLAVALLGLASLLRMDADEDQLFSDLRHAMVLADCVEMGTGLISALLVDVYWELRGHRPLDREVRAEDLFVAIRSL